MPEKKKEKSATEIARANIKGWNQHVLYYQKHSTITDKKRMILRDGHYANTFKKMQQLAHGFKDKQVLDVGCGGGTILDMMLLQQNIDTLVGLDISYEMIRVFNRKSKKLGANIFLVVGSAEQLPFKPDAFDTAAIFQSLHHFPRPEIAVKELASAAKQVILLEPNCESFVHMTAHWIRSLRQNRFSITSLPENLVEAHAAGFSIRQITKLLKIIGVAKVEGMSVGAVPTWFHNFPKSIAHMLFLLEDKIRKLPIIKWQLGSMLIVATKSQKQ